MFEADSYSDLEPEVLDTITQLHTIAARCLTANPSSPEGLEGPGDGGSGHSAFGAGASSANDGVTASSSLEGRGAGDGNGDGGNSDSGAGASSANVGDVASVLWCLAELAGQWQGRSAAAGTAGGGAAVSSSSSSTSSFASPELLAAVSSWLLNTAAASSNCNTGSEGVTTCLVDWPPPFSGPDGVSITWGFGKLMGSCPAAAAPAQAGAAMDALCLMVAESVQEMTAGVMRYKYSLKMSAGVMACVVACLLLIAGLDC